MALVRVMELVLAMARELGLVEFASRWEQALELKMARGLGQVESAQRLVLEWALELAVVWETHTWAFTRFI